MSKPAFCGLFLASVILAVSFRLVRMDSRPMHHDEANQALKFSALLETGEYRYDRNDHHGPTLYYLTLPFARARGQKMLSALDETTLRIVPALCGVGLILLLGLFADGLGRKAIIFSSLFAALSPSLTYYSRYYIQESLFVLFSVAVLISLGRYALKPGLSWALATGACAGLAYATKETAILVFAAAGIALVLARIWTRSTSPDAGLFFERPGKRIAHILAAFAIGVIIAVTLYSSFYRYPQGAMESFTALGDYAVRGIDAGIHAHPWFFYLRILAFSSSAGVVWSEGLILILALIAVIAAFSRAPVSGKLRRFDPAGNQFWLRYILSYTVLLTLSFSVIRYKTPWNLLTFHAGFIILAGSGTAALLHWFRSSLGRAVIILAILAGCVHLGVQNWRANFLYPADPRNPYVYAQTGPDFLRLSRRIHDLAAIHPDGDNMLVKVVAGPYEQWPLPWYLRDLKRVGYWTAPDSAGKLTAMPVIIASQQNMESLAKILGESCQVEFYGLRPDVLLAVFIDRPLWERYINRR
jgi:uncharacterized protein (TIGR03663 family)